MQLLFVLTHNLNFSLRTLLSDRHTHAAHVKGLAGIISYSGVSLQKLPIIINWCPFVYQLWCTVIFCLFFFPHFRHALWLVLMSICGNAGAEQAVFFWAIKQVAACVRTRRSSSLSSPSGPSGLYRYTLLHLLSNNTLSMYFQLPLMAQWRWPHLQEVPEGVFLWTRCPRRKAAPGKTSQAVYTVTGITLYLLSSILQFMNDCGREQSVHNA